MNPSILEWQEKVEEAKLGGGTSRIDKQHKAGKLTARERIDYLLDPGTFQEIGMFVESKYARAAGKALPNDGVVCGYGTVAGRPVYVYGHDFTVFGGSVGEMTGLKQTEMYRMAVESGIPIITMNDSGGGRLNEAPDTSNFCYIYQYNVKGSGWIPQISAIMGPCAGGAAYSPAITDFIFMVNGTSNMFLTGPQVIKEVTGENVDKESLGGARVHTQKSGVAHFAAVDDYDCIDQIKTLLSFLPQNASEKPPVYQVSDDPARVCPELNDIIPDSLRKAFEIRDVIHSITDDHFFFEVMKDWATNVVIGFGRMAGRSVGFIANQPRSKGGCMDMDASDKAARFVRFCDAFGIPLIYLVDTPGFLPGVSQEYGGVLRHGAKLLYANCEANVPKIVVVLRKFYGGCNAAMCGEGMGSDLVFYWPTGLGALTGAEGAVNILYGKKLAAMPKEEQAAERKRLIDEYNEEYNKPYPMMRNFHADEIILPSDTRTVLNNALTLLSNKKELIQIHKKHGNMPL